MWVRQNDNTSKEERKKKVEAKPKYRKEWENCEGFKASTLLLLFSPITIWHSQMNHILGSSRKGDHYFFCNVYRVDCKGGKSAVERHGKRRKHRENLNKIKDSTTSKNIYNH